MTFLAKLLVLINLVLCVVMAAWALALYTNRVNWSDPDKKTGLYVEIQKKLKEEGTAYPPAAVRWYNAREQVLVRETGKAPFDKSLEKHFASRPADHVWYALELQHPLYTATAQSPAREVKRDATGQPILDANNFDRPVMERAKGRDGKDLLSLKYYNERELIVLKDLESEYAKQQNAIADDLAYTDLMNGVGKNKGLKQRLTEEREKYLTIEKDQEAIESQLIFASASTQAIRDRLEQLKERKGQLEKKE